MITFLELRIQKKSEKRPQKWARNSDPFLVPLSIGIFPEGSENGRILGPAFWCWRTTFELIFGIAQSGRGATISSATCSRRTPKCSQLMLALNTYSFQTIKLKLAAFLPSAAPTVRSEYEFCLYVHLLTFWCNGWTFRKSLPISKSLRCDQLKVATTTQMQGRFWGLKSARKRCRRTKGLHNAGRPCLDVGVMHTARLRCCFSLFPAR